MHWLAIGILSLLTLSMMIRSRHFRVLVGTVAVVVVAIVAVFSFVGTQGLPSAGDGQVRRPPRIWWRFQFIKDPDFRQTATTTSKEILADMVGDDVADSIDNQLAESPSDDDLSHKLSKDPPRAVPREPAAAENGPTKVPHSYLIKLTPSGSDQVPEEVSLHEKMAHVIREYLEQFHHPRLDAGVDLLEPEDLDWRKLRFLNKGRNEKGVKQVTILFDDSFHDHVRQRGRQLLIKDHLKKAGFTSAGTLSTLAVLFGLLRLKAARQERSSPKDLLTASGVWMV